MHLLEFPSERDFDNIVRSNMIVSHVQRHRAGSALHIVPTQHLVDSAPDHEPQNAVKHQEGAGRRSYMGTLK